MVATLRIKGDVQSGMFAELNVDLAKAIGNTDELAKSAQQMGEALPTDDAGELRKAVQELTASMREFNVDSAKSVTIVNEQRTSWLTMANTAVPAIGSISTAMLTYIVRMKELDIAKQAALRSLNLLGSSQRAWAIASEYGTKTAIRGTAGLAGYGAAAGLALGAVTALGLGIKGMGILLDNTGKKFVAYSDNVETLTEEQGKYFKEMIQQANSLGLAVDDIANSEGIDLEKDWGLKMLPEYESNLDRLKTSAGGVSDSLSRLASESGPAAAYVLKNMVGPGTLEGMESLYSGTMKFGGVLDELFGSGAINRGVERWVENLDGLSELISGISRETAEASRAISEAQQLAVDDFARVRVAEAMLGEMSAARGRAAEIAGIKTSGAIDNEITKLKERRGIAAAANKFDEDAQKRYIIEIERLENRRAQIETQAKLDRETSHKAEQDRLRKNTEETFARYEQQAAEANERRLKMADDAIAAAEKQAAEERRIAAETAKLQWEIDQNIKRSNEAAAKAYEDRWKAVTGRIAALIRGQDPNAPGQDIIEQIKGNISQKDLAEQVGKRRAAAAGEEFAGSDKAQKIRDLLKSQGMEDPDIARKMTAMRRQIEQRAGQQGARDVMGGKASDAELLDAQNNLIAQNVNAATETGKLSTVAAEGLRQAAAQSIQASNEAAQARQIAEQVLQALGQSNPRGRAAKNGGR
jgi:hypothetical protein